MSSKGYNTVDALYVGLNKNKTLRTTIYKLLSNKEVSTKKLEYLLSGMTKNNILVAEESEKLKVRILLWKAFPAYRTNMKALKKLF